MSVQKPNHQLSSFAALVVTIALVAVTLALAQRQPAGKRQTAPSLSLEIVDASTSKPTAARFSLIVDGEPYFPAKVGANAIRFVSVHKSRKQIYPVTYARGSGTLKIDLPASARKVAVQVSKGFEYLPVTVTKKVTRGKAHTRIALKRWANLTADGWRAADAHVHYDRLDPRGDADWLAMMAGDDLHLAHFMTLKGGQVPGIWAKQYAYGKDGEAFDGHRIICAGEEYRDSAQGHINLFGLKKIIQPISTGGMGKPPVRFNYPPLHDVFQKSRDFDGFGGVAHGASLGREPTAILDTVLGKVDFFEIANAHLYSIDLWYRLLNCGYDLPPTAGTDLPNYPYCDAWQPFLGSMRMYVRVGDKRDFTAWKVAVRQNQVFVTSGPLITLRVNKAGPGEELSLPKANAKVTVIAELSSPIGLKSFELIKNGKPLPLRIFKKKDGPVHRWKIESEIDLTESCWLAARGEGVRIQSLQKLELVKRPWIQTSAIAHTAPIRVIFDRRPIRSNADALQLLRALQRGQEHYRTNGVFAQGKQRLHMMKLFDNAIAELKRR